MSDGIGLGLYFGLLVAAIPLATVCAVIGMEDVIDSVRRYLKRERS